MLSGVMKMKDIITTHYYVLYIIPSLSKVDGAVVFVSELEGTVKDINLDKHRGDFSRHEFVSLGLYSSKCICTQWQSIPILLHSML